MVSKKKSKTKYSLSTWEEQQEWEEYLRRMSTSQTVETEACHFSETLNRDSVKRNKNKSKKLKSKEKGRHLSRNAEAVLSNDSCFEARVKGQKEKRLKKHKDKHQKEKKNKNKSELQDSCLHPLPVKKRKGKKSKSLGGSNQSITSLSDQSAETLAFQEIKFSESGRDGYGSFRSHHPVSEGSHRWKHEPTQAQSHIHPKSKNATPYRKSVVIHSLPCSFECVSHQVKKHRGTEHMEATEPTPHGTFAKEMLLKSILVSRKAHATFEDEDKALDPLTENYSKSSQVTAENNSQELFITQKTFLPAESSSEGSIGAIASFTEPRDVQCSGVLYPQLSQELFISKSTTEMATQTDDFFSSPVLSTSFRFHKLHQNQECTEQALDLSMPTRPHREPTGSTDWPVKQEHDTSCDPLHPKHTGVVSNEQNRMLPLSKAANAQLKVVQTRLNESFFFKMKGGGESPTPQSPLLDHGMTKSKMVQMKTIMKARRPSDPNS